MALDGTKTASLYRQAIGDTIGGMGETEDGKHEGSGRQGQSDGTHHAASSQSASAQVALARSVK